MNHFTRIAQAVVLSALLVNGSHVEAGNCSAACDGIGCGHCDIPNTCTGCQSDCGNTCGCNPCAEPLWTASANVLFLHRSTPSSRILAFNTVRPEENLNANAFDYGTQAGLELSITRRIGWNNAVELRYFGDDGWDAAFAGATTPNELWQLNSDPPVFVTSGDGIAAILDSKLHNAEINLTHEYSDWLDLLVGFRYVELDQRGIASLVNAAVPFTYALATHNRLYGAQFGARSWLWSNDFVTVDATGKAGIYGSHSNHGALATTNAATVVAAGTNDDTAFLGELRINGKACLTECLSIRGGYQLMWIDGVALATDQLANTDFDAGTGINTSGDVFYHGAFVGIELAH